MPILQCQPIQLSWYPTECMERLALGVETLSNDLDTTPPADVVDATLAATGDAQAFERLYHKHVARIYNLVRRMMGSEDADDVTQDIFVRAWEKLETFRGESAFGTWLHRLAVNVVLARRKRREIQQRRFYERDEVLEAISSRPPNVESAMDFEKALERLPNGAREVFVLHDVNGYKHREIAELLGITAGTSKAQLHRARMALREHLAG